MSTTMIVTSILNLLAGIGVFLVACSMMSSNLEALSSNKLKNLFAKASKSKLLGVGIGTVGTAAIQSSGATTVMVIGFVNAGIMSLRQAATIIYGANIGTTVTGQIVALGMFGGSAVSTTVIFSAFAGVGAFIRLFTKKDLVKHIGGILTGFGMLFAGLSMMSHAMNSFAEYEGVKNFLASIDNTLLLVLIGAVLTAIVQSSSVMTSVSITMVVAGLITLNQGIFLTMGSNIGSCVVALIAGLSSSKNAKRTAVIHLIFNVSGVVLFVLIGGILDFVTGGSVTFGSIFEDLFPGALQTQLAMFHTLFNVCTVIMILPLTDLLIKVVMKIIADKDGDKDETEEKPHLYYVNDYMLKTPPIAVAQVKNEILNMAEIAVTNFRASLDMICTLNFEQEEKFVKRENELNYINNELVQFTVKLSQLPMNEKDHKYVSTAFHTVSDLERIGDYAENIVEYATTLKDSKQGFSVSAISEIQYLREHIDKLYANIIKAYTENNPEAFKVADEIEEQIDKITDRMAGNHIIRLNEGICTPLVGAQYLSLASNAERVADHMINIGKTVLKK